MTERPAGSSKVHESMKDLLGENYEPERIYFSSLFALVTAHVSRWDSTVMENETRPSRIEASSAKKKKKVAQGTECMVWTVRGASKQRGAGGAGRAAQCSRCQEQNCYLRRPLSPPARRGSCTSEGTSGTARTGVKTKFTAASEAEASSLHAPAAPSEVRLLGL